MKRCCKCKQNKSKTQFSKSRNYWCKNCCKEYRKKNAKQLKIQRKRYNKKNVEQIKAYRKKSTERMKVYMKKYRKRNAKQIKAVIKRYAEKHRERVKTWRKKYNEKHMEQVKAYIKRYRKNNNGRIAAYTGKRKAALIQRCPKWLTSKQKQQIIDFYVNCPKGMAVDHIYPLQGKYVSGLHHPDNLQYLTKSKNSKKHNNCPEIDNLWAITSNLEALKCQMSKQLRILRMRLLQVSCI